MRNIWESYAELPKFLRRPLWRIWHNFLVARDKSFDIKFMNYGFAHLDDTPPLNLEAEDELERFCINLYHHDVRAVPLAGKDILEVGCGRGGGASYITRYLQPNSYVGLDISKKAIKFCNANYDVPGLRFQQGKAEALPFDKNCFDAVVNVESSRCYGDMPGFLAEVARVLKPGGHLLFSDMRSHEGYRLLKRQFARAGLEIQKEEDILPNVVKALDLDTDRRVKLAAEKAPKFLQKSVYEFSGTKGSTRYQLFADGTMGYYSFILQVPLASSSI